MIINHNLNAMSAHRQMGINTGNQGKAIEKLSSGLRINRAGDDAAGLAISEKMRGQIRGLEGASRNAQDGVSLIQTAEGALNETHNILQRMRELSVQGANDTNVSEDREAITKEMNALKEEIDRISTDTEFNGQKLLNGEFKDKNLQIGANTNQNVGLDISNMNSDALGLNGTDKVVATEIKPEMQTTPAGTKHTASAELDITGIQAGAVKINGQDVTVKAGDGVAEVAKAINDAGITGVTAEVVDGKVTVNMSADTAGDLTIAAGTTTDAGITGPATTATTPPSPEKTGLKEELKVGIELNGEVKEITFAAGSSIDEMNDTLKATAGLEKLTASIAADGKLSITSSEATDKLVVGEKLGSVSVDNHESATKSITVLDNAINQVSSQRADLGALQNRLEHTIATNNNSGENLQAAESRIRDVDMAKEMMNLSKNNVLVQAAQTMLGQANQQPNQVLSLLR
ncbi:MAG: flagellin [Sarcina sp.]